MEEDVRLQKLFLLILQGPSKETLPPGFLNRAPTERDLPPPTALSTISQKVGKRRVKMRELSVLCKRYVIYPVRHTVSRISLCIQVLVSGIAL